MRPRDQYVVGRTGSFHVPTVLKLDGAITELTSQIADASPERRAKLWDDIDALLTRRFEMTASEPAR